jgi:hypothetical protein
MLIDSLIFMNGTFSTRGISRIEIEISARF